MSDTDGTCISHRRYFLFRVSPLPLGDPRRPSFPIKKEEEEEKKNRRRKNRGDLLLYSFFSSFFLLPLLFLSSSSSHVREHRRGVGRLPSVKGFNKTMSSSLGESNMCMMVRSSPKLFWNGVLDRIIRFLVQSSARTFQISLFGRPFLKFIQKGKLSYPGHHSKITLEDFVMP